MPTPAAKLSFLLAAALAATAALAEPTSAPTVIDASDAAAIADHMGKDVVIEGVVNKAAWSSSGKVMSILFKGVDRNQFSAVAFDKIKDKLDAAFMGDAAKDFTGAKVRIRGTLSSYKDSPQLVVSMASQVTIVEPAAGTSTTMPAAQ